MKSGGYPVGQFTDSARRPLIETDLSSISNNWARHCRNLKKVSFCHFMRVASEEISFESADQAAGSSRLHVFFRERIIGFRTD